jgi:hypothetical protein
MKALHSASGTGIGYNPGITYRGGEFLAQGIAQAGNAVAEGLAQFRKNREERDFLDQQRQTLAAELGKFKDFEKAANEDDSSPAGQFLKTFANWDNLSLAKQKAAVVDGQHYLAKREQEAQRTRAEQWHLLAEQRAQEGLELQRQNLGLAKGQAGVQAMTALANLYNQVKDNARADAYLWLAQKAQGFTLKRQEDEAARKAKEDAALAGFGRDFSRYAGEDFVPDSGVGMLRPMTSEQRRDAALGRNPGAFASDRFDTNAAALMRFALKPSDGWGLRPGQGVPLPDGSTGIATTPNSLQVPPKAEAAIFAKPEYSPDGKMYRSSPTDKWHPVREMDPLTAAILARSGLIPGGKAAPAAPAYDFEFDPKTRSLSKPNR